MWDCEGCAGDACVWGCKVLLEHLPLEPLSPHADGKLREESKLGTQHGCAHLSGCKGV